MGKKIVNRDLVVGGDIYVYDPASNSGAIQKVLAKEGNLSAAAGSVGTAELADLGVTTAKIAADAIDGTKLADNACDSEHYTDGSIDTAHLAADAIDGTLIADDAVDSEHIAAGAVDEDLLVVPTAAGLGIPRVAKMRYVFGTDGGAQGAITPADTSEIPDNAIILGGVLDITTQLTSGGSATISVGTTAGSGAATIVPDTAVASWDVGLDLALTPVFTAATMFKMTAAGSLNLTVSTADLTAGVFEIQVFYVVGAN